MGYNRSNNIMAKTVTQVLDNKDDSGSGGLITVIATDENGKQTTASYSYSYSGNRQDAIDRATKKAIEG